jgi:hypothetical protein
MMNDCCEQGRCGGEDCSTIVGQCMEVATPVRIDVTSKSKGMKIECGKPIICDHAVLDCYRKSSCEFVVKQCLHVKIPIDYHVKADVAESYVKCKKKCDCSSPQCVTFK